MKTHTEQWHTAHVIARGIDHWWLVSPHWQHVMFWLGLVFTMFSCVGFVVNIVFLLFGIRKLWNPLALFATGLEFFVALFVIKQSYQYIAGRK